MSLEWEVGGGSLEKKRNGDRQNIKKDGASRPDTVRRAPTGGKDSESDNKGHKRSRLHANWARLPCLGIAHTHTQTHTLKGCTPEQLLPQQSPLCSFIWGGLLGLPTTRSQGERQTHKQRRDRRTWRLAAADTASRGRVGGGGVGGGGWGGGHTDTVPYRVFRIFRLLKMDGWTDRQKKKNQSIHISAPVSSWVCTTTAHQESAGTTDHSCVFTYTLSCGPRSERLEWVDQNTRASRRNQRHYLQLGHGERNGNK